MPLYSTPLGSPTDMSKRSYVHVPGVPRVVVQRPCSGYGTWVGIRWVYRVGVPGEYYPATARGTQLTAKRARKPCRAGVVVSWVGACPCTTPAGPGRPAASLYRDPLERRLLANKGEI